MEYQNSVEQINLAAKNGPAAFIAETEHAFHENIRKIAEHLARESQSCRLVMLAGPSSSGKTTSAHLLADALREAGTGSAIISLDNFYLGEYQAPILPNGQHDYENVYALDVPRIQQCLYDLVETGTCEMPVFDFEIRKPSPRKRRMTLEEGQIAVVEGIHALNPLLISLLPAMQVKKIYISVKQGIHEGETEIFGPNEVRLIRRIVRDYNFRGTRPERTLEMWANVMAGERNYIKPYRKDADFTINSLHAYELCVLKKQAVELLHTVPHNSPMLEYSKRLLDGLDRFEAIDGSLVPKNSIIREFIGGGIY